MVTIRELLTKLEEVDQFIYEQVGTPVSSTVTGIMTNFQPVGDSVQDETLPVKGIDDVPKDGNLDSARFGDSVEEADEEDEECTHGYDWGFADDLPDELKEEPDVVERDGHKIESWPYDGDVYGAIDGHEYKIGWARDEYQDVEDILQYNPDLVSNLGSELAKVAAASALWDGLSPEYVLEELLGLPENQSNDKQAIAQGMKTNFAQLRPSAQEEVLRILKAKYPMHVAWFMAQLRK